MAKAKKDKELSKKQLKAEKKAKGVAKADRKASKAAKKKRKDEGIVDEADLLQTLEDYRKAWEAEHAVSMDIASGPPSRRANASFIACPLGEHLWLFGGEFFASEERCEFYNDMYRYEPGKNEWRRYTSPTCPGPRSACSMVGTPAQGGQIWLFGGEFAAANLSSFMHYRDLWCFTIATHSWERFETRVRPSARSGHRMALYKNAHIVLYGGFVDTGIKTRYLSDLWVWDLQAYRWSEITFGPFDRQPGPRSGFSFLPYSDGIYLFGGYRKEYTQKRSKGVALDDLWLLTVDTEELKKSKWEKKKRLGFAPSLRSGTTMALWSAKSIGVLFGGVTDEEETDETIKSTFHNDSFGLQLTNGRWISLNLKRKKKAGGKRKIAPAPVQRKDSDDEMDEDSDADTDDRPAPAPVAEPEDPDDPERSRPHPRYATHLAVQRNMLYLYGGILESRSREATLDDFFVLDLVKLDRFNCLRAAEIDWGDQESESEGEDEMDGEDSSSNSDDAESVASEEAVMQVDEPAPEPVADPAADLRDRAQAFLSLSQQIGRAEEDKISTPMPGETLRMFYERSRQHWAAVAHNSSDNRGKLLRRDGFQIAEQRYEEYLPLLMELEKIQQEAGLDADEIKAGAGSSASAASRNRR